MKTSKWAMAGVVVLLSACGPLSTPEALPTETVAPAPTATATAVPPTGTPEPSPTPDPLLFRDEFDGSLGEGWHWLREKDRYWSLTERPGWLQIMARGGMLRENTITNLLLREAAAEDFEIETRVSFIPGGIYQSAGVIMYDQEGWVSLIRAFCPEAHCAGDAFYLDKFTGGNYSGNNFATKAPETDEVRLRLRRQGDIYMGWMSLDGTRWTLIGSHQKPEQPLQVGILAGQAWSTVPQPAQFDYFVVNAVP
jgi:beta-xylosidase